MSISNIIRWDRGVGCWVASHRGCTLNTANPSWLCTRRCARQWWQGAEVDRVLPLRDAGISARDQLNNSVEIQRPQKGSNDANKTFLDQYGDLSAKQAQIHETGRQRSGTCTTVGAGTGCVGTVPRNMTTSSWVRKKSRASHWRRDNLVEIPKWTSMCSHVAWQVNPRTISSRLFTMFLTRAKEWSTSTKEYS